MAKVIRGYWDCPHCGKKGIDGLLDACPSCGSGKDKNVRYYMKSVYDTVTQEELEKARIGKDELDGKHKDWLCAYCGYLNRYSDQKCGMCGAPKEEKEQEYGDNFAQDDAKRAEKEAEAAEFAEAVERGSILRRHIPRPLLFLLPVLLLFVLFFPFGRSFTVTGFSWEREVDIETYTTLQEDDWNLPQGARLQKTQEEISGYQTVVDHYEQQYVTKYREVLDHYETQTSYRDNGNGTFSEESTQIPIYKTESYQVLESVPIYVQLPVYSTRYYYEIDRWVITEQLPTSGKDHSPYWAEGYTLADDQRDTRRREDYWTVLSDGSTLHDDYETWAGRELGDVISEKRSLAGIRY